MNTPVQQNYLMIQGEYLDGTPGVEMVAGGFDNYKLGDAFQKHPLHKDSSPCLRMGDNPKRYPRSEVKPWTVIKVFTQEEQALLKEIERMHNCTPIENLFASNVQMMRTPVYSAS